MKYKICAEPSSFKPTEIRWNIYRRDYFFEPWSFVAMYDTKTEALEVVDRLISCGGPFYYKG